MTWSLRIVRSIAYVAAGLSSSLGLRGLSAERVTIPVQAVGVVAPAQPEESAMQLMMAPQVEVPVSKYADVPDAELERAPDDSTVRFLLALPEQLVLVDINVAIDGKPFRSARQERIEALISGRGEGDSVASQYSKYTEITKRTVSRDEGRWLLRRWGEGDSLVTLSENFERARASQSPVRDVLDRNGDAVIDQQELASAVETLARCDTDQDDVVEASEVRKAASSFVSSSSTWEPPELMIRLDDPASLTRSLESFIAYCEATGASKALTSIAAFDSNDDQRIEQTEFASIIGGPTAIDVAIQFANPSAQEDSSGCQVSAESDIRASGGSALTELAGSIVEVTAVRGAAANLDQISMGVVNDGYPIAPLLDPNADSRITIRELRELPERLRFLDRNQDQKITPDETRPTIRISIGHGLCVHDQLSTVRRVHPTDQQQPTAPPEWFVSLDKNRDGDISKREFVGTPEQFSEMDRDQDGLISTTEAIQP